MSKSIHDENMTFLRWIIERWPKKNSLPSSDLLGALTREFDAIDFLNEVHGLSKVQLIQSAQDRSCAIIFEDKTGMLHRAVLVADKGRLSLASLKFECPACFGSGVNDGEKCILCGGGGWGVGKGG